MVRAGHLWMLAAGLSERQNSPPRLFKVDSAVPCAVLAPFLVFDSTDRFIVINEVWRSNA